MAQRRRQDKAVDRWAENVIKLLTRLKTGLSTMLSSWDDFCQDDLPKLRESPSFVVSYSKLRKLFRELRSYEPTLANIKTRYEDEIRRVRATMNLAACWTRFANFQ